MTVTRGRALALIGLVLLSSVVGAVGAAVAAGGNDELNWDADSADDWYVYEDTLTVAEHNRSAMSSPLQFYNDNGDVDELPAQLNESIDNPVSVRADMVHADAYGIFPRKDAESGDNSASAVDASEWTSDLSGSAGSGSVSATTTPGGVDAVSISTSSQTSGDVATFTYSNFSISTDPAKRVPLLGVNVNTLDSGADVQVRFEDGGGDYAQAVINASATSSSKDVIANATGNGYIWQHKLADMSVQGDDGTLDSIEKIEVRVVDADADVSIFAVDAEHKTTLTFGERTTDDGETKTIEEVHAGGYQSLSALSTMGSWANDATISDLKVSGVEYRMSNLEAADVSTNFTSADAYPSFPTKLKQSGGLVVPSAIDLSHSGLSLRVEQSLVDERYKTFRYAEGVGDKDAEDVDSWTDASNQLGGAGDTIVVDDTIQPGATIMPQEVVVLTADEVSNLRATGGGAGPVGGGDGGIVGMLFSLPGLLFASLLGALGFKARGS